MAGLLTGVEAGPNWRRGSGYPGQRSGVEWFVGVGLCGCVCVCVGGGDAGGCNCTKAAKLSP